jgi:hypothetical protein
MCQRGMPVSSLNPLLETGQQGQAHSPQETWPRVYPRSRLFLLIKLSLEHTRPLHQVSSSALHHMHLKMRLRPS